MTASPPGKTGSGGAVSSKPTKRSKAKPAQTEKRRGWSLKSDTAPQPRLGFNADAGNADVQPAAIDTVDLMLATRRATAALDDDGMPRDEFIRFVAAELGYERTSKQVAKAIDNALRAASRRRIVFTEAGRVYIDCQHIGQYDREDLKKTLLSVVGRTWTNRDEAITAATRHLGFERTGKKIKQALTSALTGLLRQGELERSGNDIRRT